MLLDGKSFLGVGQTSTCSGFNYRSHRCTVRTDTHTHTVDVSFHFISWHSWGVREGPACHNRRICFHSNCFLTTQLFLREQAAAVGTLAPRNNFSAISYSHKPFKSFFFFSTIFHTFHSVSLSAFFLNLSSFPICFFFNAYFSCLFALSSFFSRLSCPRPQLIFSLPLLSWSIYHP